MAQSKIEFRLGDLHFVGEGDKSWVTQQLDKIINKAPSLLRVGGSGEGDNFLDVTEKNYGNKASGKTRNNGGGRKSAKSIPTPQVSGVKSAAQLKELSSFIKSKAASNQRAKFLAAAIWLNKKGKNEIVTRDVTRALKDARISLINPSQYLNQNVKQGYLKKSGNGFVPTKKGVEAF